MLNSVSQLNEGTRQQIITADHNYHKEQLVDWLLANETYDKAIVFTNTRVQADRLYGKLVAAGVKAFVLHGEKDQNNASWPSTAYAREQSLPWWPPTWLRAVWTSKAWIW